MEIKSKSATVRGPADWFTGDVYIDSVVQAQEPSRVNIGAVHFTPGARTAWHTHDGGQNLYVTEGVGRVQSRGGAPEVIRPGDVIHTPSGEWHWHGAAPDHFMTHLSVTEGATTWGEHVSDADYLS